MNGRMRVAHNLRRIRVNRGLSQESLAVDAGVDRTYVSGLEGGKVNPSLDLLERLALVLTVDISKLLEPVKEADAPVMPLKAGRRPKK